MRHRRLPLVPLSLALAVALGAACGVHPGPAATGSPRPEPDRAAPVAAPVVVVRLEPERLDLPPDRRVQLLSDTIEVALTTGASEEDGREAHFALLFDEAADGLFVIVITPKA